MSSEDPFNSDQFRNLLFGNELSPLFTEHGSYFFNRWFEKDTNSLPPTYIASRISSKLPDFKSEEKEKRDAAKKKWWAESELIQNTLEEVALKIFDAERARKYVRSGLNFV